MGQQSAGILLYRRDGAGVDVLLVLPGGPWWRNRGEGAWQIPKGAIEPGEAPIEAARRETEEELGIAVTGTPVPLARVRQAGGKMVQGFALEQDVDPAAIVSNRFDMEWPRGSGRTRSYPEIEEGRWFPLDQARTMMLESQQPLLDALETMLG